MKQLPLVFSPHELGPTVLVALERPVFLNPVTVHKLDISDIGEASGGRLRDII